MIDSSDMLSVHGQRVRIDLNNTRSVELATEDITVHFIASPSERFRDPQQSLTRTFETVSRTKLGPRQEAPLAIALNYTSAVKYVELNSVTYARLKLASQKW